MNAKREIPFCRLAMFFGLFAAAGFKRASGCALGAILLAAGVLGAFAPGRAQAQSSIPREETWVTNGPVYAIARTVDTVYMGGNFTYVGPNTGCGAALDASTGRPQGPFPHINGTVQACAADGAGGWFIGGEFTRVGGLERNCIAHIRSDGSVDPAWNPNAGGTLPYVYALAVSGSTVYAGGWFTNIGGQSRNNIAALNAATGSVTDWNPDASSTVGALAVSGKMVYVGGAFTSIGGQSRNHIAALSTATGNATVWNPNANAQVVALAVSGSTVYAGGYFTSIGGQARNAIAALEAATGNATGWNPNPANGYDIYGHPRASCVYALAVSGSTIYATGGFISIGGQTRSYIAALDAATGNATDWNPHLDGGIYSTSCISAVAVSGSPDPAIITPIPMAIYTLVVSGAKVYAGGRFTSIAGQMRNNIVALDATTGNVTDWNPNAGSVVRALAVSGSTVYAGGDFTSIGGQSRNSIAALDAATGNATAWNPNADYIVHALAVSGSTVYAGGEFGSIGGLARYHIAALDAATGNATPWNPNADGISPYVSALAVSGSTVYAGGGFTTIGGQPRKYIAALDVATGNATPWNPNAGGPTYPYVSALIVSGSIVYAGGYFTSIGGQTRNYIAALDAATGSATAWNPNASSVVRALMVSGPTVYAGGLFSSIGGQSRHGIAALDAATGNAASWNPNAGGVSPYVYALAVSDSMVYAGGYFTTIGGQSRNYIATLDAATGDATDWDPNAGGSYPHVNSLAVSGSLVYIGGNFTTIGGEPRPNFAQFGTPPTAADKWPLY